MTANPWVLVTSVMVAYIGAIAYKGTLSRASKWKRTFPAVFRGL